jgi:hypothetical protein
MVNTMAQFRGKSPREEILSDMKKSHRRQPSVNEHEVRELELWVDNDRNVAGQLDSIRRNYQRKKSKGIYNHELAVKGFMNAVNNSNRGYKKDFGYSFSVPVRRKVAQNLTKHFETEYRLGNRW